MRAIHDAVEDVRRGVVEDLLLGHVLIEDRIEGEVLKTS